MHIRVVALSCVLASAGCVHVGKVVSPIGARHAQKDPWSQAGLDAALNEVLPLVEEAAGREFVRKPKVAIADEAEFQQLLMAEQLRIYEQVMPDTPVAIREELAAAAGQFMTSGILGKYVLATETVYVCPNALIPAMTESGLDPSRAMDVVRVVVAHEIVHALEDQHTDLDRILDGLRDEESLWAASGAWEGWATLIEERVSAQLGIGDVFEALISLQGWGADGVTDPSSWRTWAIYGQGKDFVAWHDAHGGHEAVWAVLEVPPPSTSMLFRPHTYQPTIPEPALDYPAILRGVEAALGDGDWLVTNSRLGEFDLRGEAMVAGNEEELDRILAHLEHAQRLDVAQPDRSAEVRLLVFDGPTWPREYLDLIRTQQTHDSLETALALGLPVEIDYNEFDQIPSDDAILRVETIPLFGGLAEQKHSAWIVRGEVVVVVQASRFEPGERLGHAAGQVFDRLARARTLD